MSTKDSIIGQVHEYDVDMRNRRVFLHGEVDEETLERFSKNMHLLKHRDANQKPITIEICTTGGYVSYGWGIYDLIKESKVWVTVEILSKCESMGTIIVQGADEVIMHKNARFMVHVGTESYAEDHANNIKRWQGWSDKDEKKTQDVMITAIKRKKPRYTREKLQKLIEFDTIMEPKEALEYGLIDKIYGE
jgi:ATP-dependent protease ClpP protease subunit